MESKRVSTVARSPEMRDARCRDFTLLDAMIVVATTAVGCGLIKWSRIDFLRLIYPDPRYRPFPRGYITQCVHGMSWTVVPFLASWSLGLLFIRMRRPRPERRRLFRQPGVVA